MDIAKYEPLLLVYFKDPIEWVCTFTTPLSNLEKFKEKVKKEYFIEMEGRGIKTSYIYKYEPLEDVDDVTKVIYSQPYAIRQRLFKLQKEGKVFTSVEHVANYIEGIKEGKIW